MEFFENYIKEIELPDKKIMDQTKKKLDNLTKPKGSLGKLEELAIIYCGIKGKTDVKIKNKVIFTLAGDHGVCEENVSAYPQEVTEQMVYNFLKGTAAINVLARHVGAEVIVVDIGVKKDIFNEKVIIKKVDYGTKNFTKQPAMTRKQAIQSINYGIEIVEGRLKKSSIDIAGVGDMGIGNTTPSSAIVSVITGNEVEKVTGYGTGISDDIYKRKIDVIKKAISFNKPDPSDPIDVLSKVGGFEIGGIAGVIIGCAKNRIPVLIDGFISGAGALIAYKISPITKNYMIASHLSSEPGHKILLDYIGLEPLLNLNLRLGEGTGAALGIFLVESGIKILNEMATFEEAGVSKEIK